MTAKRLSDFYLQTWEAYREAHDNAPGTAMQAIKWAEENGMYAVDEVAARRRGARELAKVLGNQTVLSEDGTEVRLNVPYYDRGQGWLWDSLPTIAHDKMEIGMAHNHISPRRARRSVRRTPDTRFRRMSLPEKLGYFP